MKTHFSLNGIDGRMVYRYTTTQEERSMRTTVEKYRKLTDMNII